MTPHVEIPSAITSYFESSRIPLSLSSARQPDVPLILVNEAFVQMSGYSREECVGKNCRFLQAGHQQDDERQKLRDAIRDGTEVFVTLTNFRKDGQRFLNHLFMFPVHAKSGELEFLIGSQCDMKLREDYSIAQERAARLGSDFDRLNQTLRECGQMSVETARLVAHAAKSTITTRLKLQDLKS